MNIRRDALNWLEKNDLDCKGRVFSSKYFPPEDSWKGKPRWWIEFSADVLSSTNQPEICLALQKHENTPGFYFLRIPFKYLSSKKYQLSYRAEKNRYSLIISLESKDCFKDIRGKGLNLSRFLINNCNKHSETK